MEWPFNPKPCGIISPWPDVLKFCVTSEWPGLVFILFRKNVDQVKMEWPLTPKPCGINSPWPDVSKSCLTSKWPGLDFMLSSKMSTGWKCCNPWPSNHVESTAYDLMCQIYVWPQNDLASFSCYFEKCGLGQNAITLDPLTMWNQQPMTWCVSILCDLEMTWPWFHVFKNVDRVKMLQPLTFKPCGINSL